MEAPFDLLEVAGRACKKHNFKWTFVGLESVDSTNTYSKTHYEDFDGPTLIVARHQTAGRGRGENSWQDDGPGLSFLSTWTMELFDGPAAPWWTLGIGLYLYESLSEAFKWIRFNLKAPNDIYINDKKVGGILVEGTTQGDIHFLHVGIGINVFSYPAEFSKNATHLNAYLGADQLTPEAWQQFLDYFGTRLINLEERVHSKIGKSWLEKMSPRLVEALNRNPQYEANPIKAIGPSGDLILESGKLSWKDL